MKKNILEFGGDDLCISLCTDGVVDGITVCHRRHLETVRQWIWHLTVCGYVRSNTVGGRSWFLHRLLLGLEPHDNRICDHYDGDKLNNRDPNISVCNQVRNSFNRPCRGYRKVGHDRESWQAMLVINGEKHYGPIRYAEKEAECDRIRMELKHYGFLNPYYRNKVIS
jgi:hypothetical protein